MAISLLAGFTVGLSPNASAHKDTGSVAVVTGEVKWPGPADGADDKAFFDLGDEWRDTSDLSILDVRHPENSATPGGDPLNGCRLEGGNSAPGLPVGTLGGPVDDNPPLDPLELEEWLTEKGEPRTLDNHDLCFIFTGFDINAVGIYEGRAHATNFDCEASGTTGATGDGSSATDPDVTVSLEDVEDALPTFGAFYGEFTCDGEPLLPGDKDFVPSADGHFHGLTVASTTIAFLGVVHCTVDNLGRECPAEDDRRQDGTSKTSPDKNVNESRIKHTLACKGEVVLPVDEERWVEKNPSFLDGEVTGVVPISNALLSADVVLECVIA